MSGLIYGRKVKMSPCKNCKDRKVGCHTTCNKYQKYKSEEKPKEYEASSGWNFSRRRSKYK